MSENLPIGGRKIRKLGKFLQNLLKMANFSAQNRRGAKKKRKKKLLAYFGPKIGVFLENLDRGSGILADRGSEILQIGGPKFCR